MNSWRYSLTLLWLLLTAGCSRPWIEVVVPPHNSALASRASRCLIDSEKCTKVRGQQLEHCIKVNDSDPDGVEIILYGNYGIMCAEEDRALKECPERAQYCLLKTGAAVNLLNKGLPPSKAVDFDRVKTTGKYLILFSDGFNIPLSSEGETVATFARPVSEVSSTHSSVIEDNTVHIPDLKSHPLAAPTEMDVTLNDGSKCRFILQPEWVGPFTSREYTFDCHLTQGARSPSATRAPPPRPSPTPPSQWPPNEVRDYKRVKVKGLYLSFTEVSAFRACNSSEVWFLSATNREVVEAIAAIRARSSCKAPNCSFAFEIEGKLSPLGEYGHMNGYVREVLVDRVIASEDPDDHSKCRGQNS